MVFGVLLMLSLGVLAVRLIEGRTQASKASTIKQIKPYLITFCVGLVLYSTGLYYITIS